MEHLKTTTCFLIRHCCRINITNFKAKKEKYRLPWTMATFTQALKLPSWRKWFQDSKLCSDYIFGRRCFPSLREIIPVISDFTPFVCIWGRARAGVPIRRSADNLGKSLFLFYHTGSGDWTQSDRVGSRRLPQLSRLFSPILHVIWRDKPHVLNCTKAFSTLQWTYFGTALK